MKEKEILKHEISEKIEKLMVDKNNLICRRLPKVKLEIVEPEDLREDDIKPE